MSLQTDTVMDDDEQSSFADGTSDGDLEPPAASERQRPRFDGTSTELANSLRLVVTALGIHFSGYDEPTKVQQSKVDVKAILRSTALAAMHSLKSNLVVFVHDQG